MVRLTRPLACVTLAASAWMAVGELASRPAAAEVAFTTTPTETMPQSLPAAPFNPASINQEDYVLGPGDEVKLEMFGQADLFSTPYRILVDGTISLPFIGRVPVAGKTMRQAEQDITQRYTRFFRRPIVTMVLMSPRTVTLAVSGEVRRPGTYPLEEPNRIPTVTQLIKLAGGTTQSADLSQVQIRRSQGNGSNQVISVNLLSLLQEGDLSQDLDLRDGDTVVIPATTQMDRTVARLTSEASFAADASDPLNIAVIGEVYRPGPYTVSPSDSFVREAGETGATRGAGSRELPRVTQAIQLAGGIRPDADVRKVQVRRSTRTGEIQLIDVDLWKLLKEGDLSQDIALQQGDTVIIPTATALTPPEMQQLAIASFAPSTIDVNVVGEVKSPGTVKLPPNTPLNTAVLAAGGFDDRRANKSNVQLIRLNPDGTVVQRRIAVDFNQAVNEDSNPPLRNNDVVVIGRSGLTQFSDTLSNITAPLTGGIFSIIRPFF
nr:SLBB domain-containing protein [Petrachloros mirabilis]